MTLRAYLGSTQGDLRRALFQAFEYVGLLDALAKSGKIFVKPNFTFPRPLPGVTTSREILQPTLELLSETGVEVFVGESNGGYGSFTAEEAFRGHELYDICRETRTVPLNLSQAESREYHAWVMGRRISVRLPRFLVEEVDITLSVPVLKVHAMTTVSLAVKNLWGCYPIDLRLLRHAQLGRELRLIVDLVKARYGLIDATHGLDRHGPMDGMPRRLGKFLMGNDPYALDWIAAKMMGLRSERIHHLRMIPSETLASIRRREIESNAEIDRVNWGFAIDLNVIDTLSLACFHSDILAKLVFNSPFTKPIYMVAGRKPRRKLT